MSTPGELASNLFGSITELHAVKQEGGGGGKKLLPMAPTQRAAPKPTATLSAAAAPPPFAYPPPPVPFYGGGGGGGGGAAATAVPATVVVAAAAGPDQFRPPPDDVIQLPRPVDPGGIPADLALNGTEKLLRDWIKTVVGSCRSIERWFTADRITTTNERLSHPGNADNFDRCWKAYTCPEVCTAVASAFQAIGTRAPLNTPRPSLMSLITDPNAPLAPTFRTAVENILGVNTMAQSGRGRNWGVQRDVLRLKLALAGPAFVKLSTSCGRGHSSAFG